MTGLTFKQARAVREFCINNRLRLNDTPAERITEKTLQAGATCFTIQKLSDYYAFVTKEDKNKFSIAGCTYDNSITLTTSLTYAKRYL